MTTANNKYMPKLFYLKNSPLEIDITQKDASITSAYEEFYKEKDAIINVLSEGISILVLFLF